MQGSNKWSGHLASPVIRVADLRPIMGRLKLCRALTEEAVETLATIMREGCSEAARIAASNAILDRGWGKARELRDLRLNDPRQMTDAQLIDIILDGGAPAPELPAPGSE